MAATFLITCLMVVFQPFGYSIFHSGDTLFDLVFYDGVTPVSISILKPSLRVIRAILLKLQASPIVGTHI